LFAAPVEDFSGFFSVLLESEEPPDSEEPFEESLLEESLLEELLLLVAAVSFGSVFGPFLLL
jgi:hypothetical protein